MAMASSLPPGFESSSSSSHQHAPAPAPLAAAAAAAVVSSLLQPGRESKKVSWASEDILCQVRLFAAEDAPAQSSSTIQELLQAKKAKMMHMINPAKNEDLPPGFGGLMMGKGIKTVVFDVVRQLPWRFPEPFRLDPSWLVMAGQDSVEVSVQKKRENRTLEAVYPRLSAIPDSPAEPSEAQSPFDDANTLIIPVVPLDDDDLPDQDEVPTTSGSTYEVLQEYTFPREKSLSPPPGFTMQTGMPTKARSWFPEAPQEVSNSMSTVSTTTPALGFPASLSRHTMPANGIAAAMQATSLSSARSTGPMVPPPAHRTNEAGPDVAAAAAAAYAALSQSNDATMIDRELLIKFLTNPSMLQNLSEKLAQNPPGGLEPSHTGNGGAPRGNGRPWIEQNKGGQRYPETSDALPGSHGYDKPPGFGAPLAAANGLAVYSAPPRPLNISAQSISPPISAAQSTVSGSGRSISQRDDQYYKDLISQHGRKNEENVWGAAAAAAAAAVGALDSGNSYGGRGARANGPDRDRKLDKAERTERSERADSGTRWAERDVDMDGVAGMPGRGQGDGGENRSGQSRGKSRKACIYFSTSRGCRNGNTCAFVHESNNGERAKRPKLEGKDSKGYR